MTYRQPALFFSIVAAMFVALFVIVFWGATASAALPGTRWGTQLELGTVGNSTVIKAMDETTWCLIFQPKNGNTPAIWCETVQAGLP